MVLGPTLKEGRGLAKSRANTKDVVPLAFPRHARLLTRLNAQACMRRPFESLGIQTTLETFFPLDDEAAKSSLSCLQIQPIAFDSKTLATVAEALRQSVDDEVREGLPQLPSRSPRHHHHRPRPHVSR